MEKMEKTEKEKIAAVLGETRKNTPIVHCITNYVTVNDVANIILACGGSPIMADDEEEAAHITSLCSALYINIGTLNQRTVSSMLEAGKRANSLGHPVILDPVGAGASKFRANTVSKLLECVRFSIIKGNISEMKTVWGGTGAGNGVDASRLGRRDKGQPVRYGVLFKGHGAPKRRCDSCDG